MKSALILLAMALLAFAPTPAFADQGSNATVTVYCFNTTINLTTDAVFYQFTDVANMTVRLNNTDNGQSLSEMLFVELYDANGARAAYMAVDNATASAGGINMTSYYQNLSAFPTGNYTVRARVVSMFSFPLYNYTATDCSINATQLKSDVNITITSQLPNPPTNLIAILNKTDETIILNWTLSNSSNVFNYIIYKTDVWYDGFNYSNAYGTASNSSYNWTDPYSAGILERYYVVRANNTLGMTDTNTYAVGKFMLRLYTGWNLVSLPLLIWNNSPDDVIYTATSDDMWVRFLGQSQSFERSNYYGGLGWFGYVSTAEYDRGYWYYSMKGGYDTTPYNNTIVGVVPTTERNETIYNSSWSMLGWTSLNTKSPDAVFTNAAGDDMLVRFDPVLDSFDRSNFYTGLGWFGYVSTVEPGRGYWYYSTNSTIYNWTYQP